MSILHRSRIVFFYRYGVNVPNNNNAVHVHIVRLYMQFVSLHHLDLLSLQILVWIFEIGSTK